MTDEEISLADQSELPACVSEAAALGAVFNCSPSLENPERAVPTSSSEDGNMSA
jgi:hypothetical protein